MRIVAFVGSPVEHDEKEAVKVAKRLKKEKVNVDIVSFGEDVSVLCLKIEIFEINLIYLIYILFRHLMAQSWLRLLTPSMEKMEMPAI